MSEEERKEKHEPKFTSIIALVLGIATFLSGLLIVPFTLCIVLDAFSIASGSMFLEVLAFGATVLLAPFAIWGLILSIVSLFIERNIYFRLLPLAFVLFGIGLLILCFSYLYTL